MLRLRSRGVKKPGSDQRGDQYVVISVVTPKDLTEEQRTLFEKLREHDPSDHRAGCDWWRERAS